MRTAEEEAAPRTGLFLSPERDVEVAGSPEPSKAGEGIFLLRPAEGSEESVQGKTHACRQWSRFVESSSLGGLRG